MADGKHRHGCLTAFLVFGIIANTLVVLFYSLASATVRAASPNLPGWALPVLSAIGVCNIAFFVAIFLWKKWGFYAFIASAAITFVINISAGLSVVSSALGLAGIAILYWVLQIGGESNGWRQLE
jgi:hypothetical protein